MTVKGKVYRPTVRPTSLYDLEAEALINRHEAELELAELPMLRFYLGATRMSRTKNDHMRGTASMSRR